MVSSTKLKLIDSTHLIAAITIAFLELRLQAAQKKKKKKPKKRHSSSTFEKSVYLIE